MPSWEYGLPVGATGLKLVDQKGYEYEIPSEASFTRVGEDGSPVILKIFGSEHGKGESLEGHWKKGWTADIDVFVAKLSGGKVEFSGAFDGADTAGVGWIDSCHVLPLLDELTLIVELEVPTSVSSGKEVQLSFLITKNKITGNPGAENDYLRLYVRNNDGTYQYSIYRNVGGSYGAVIGWTALSNDTVAVKFVFQERDSGHTHIHVDDGVSGTFTEHGSSPFALGLRFDVGFPAFQFYTTDTTDRTAASDYITVDYPDFKSNYSLPDANEGLGDVELWDTMGEASESNWQLVKDKDHKFVGDAILQNELLRLTIDEATQYAFILEYWTGSAWDKTHNRLYWYLIYDAKNLLYPYFRGIEHLSPEKVTVKVRIQDSAVDDGDFYTDFNATLERGKLAVELDSWNVFPNQLLQPTCRHAVHPRFGYVGDAEAQGIGDNDNALVAQNTTLTDNFMAAFDDDGKTAIFFVAANEKPTSYHKATNGGFLEIIYIDDADFDIAKVWMGYVPFALIASLHKEASELTYGGGATQGSLILDAQNEWGYASFTAGTDLPEGRYFYFWYAKDSNQVADDFGILVTNQTDNEYRNKENEEELETLLATYAFYGSVFDITAQDVIDGDEIRVYCRKVKADANTITVDYLVIIPIGNGEDWPQDQAHSAMRAMDASRKVHTT